jgi:hypothetical protein
MIDISFLPNTFLQVHYDGKRIPSVENEDDLTLGANCQVYAYALLRHHGLHMPPFRSSELWTDTEYTLAVTEFQPLDIMLYNKTNEAYGAHVGLCVGGDLVLHLAQHIGQPAIQSHQALLATERYACFIGAKRVKET